MNEKKNTKHRKISSDRQRRWESMENHSAKYLLTDLPVNTLRFFWSQMEYTHLNATQSSQSASYCLYVRRTNEPNELSEWACLNKIYKHFVIGNYRRNRSTDRVTYFCYFIRFRTFYSVSFFFFFLSLLLLLYLCASSSAKLCVCSRRKLEVAPIACECILCMCFCQYA